MSDRDTLTPEQREVWNAIYATAYYEVRRETRNKNSDVWIAENASRIAWEGVRALDRYDNLKETPGEGSFRVVNDKTSPPSIDFIEAYYKDRLAEPPPHDWVEPAWQENATGEATRKLPEDLSENKG